jgi:Concanavalin A-like lectin/glucanases superfamily
MPIIDVRNIPTVVEFAPENQVVEFTEDSVTAEVVVGPTVVEFSWGELIPEPGLSGGGVFEGRVYIRPDIPTLPSNSEPVDPSADYLMLWDASSDTHVKVLANLGGGGGGGDYIGVNLGTGAEVYKETNDAVDPREHKFRSIKAGSNVVVTQLANEIEIASGTGAFPGFPSNTLVIGSSDNGCATNSTTFTPINVLPALAVGDLMVWCMHIQLTTGWAGADAMLNVPVGWTPFMLPKYVGNGERLYNNAILYKWADSSDLAGASHTTSMRYSGIICSSTFAYRGMDEDRPFATLFRSDFTMNDSGANPDKLFAPPAWGISSSQPLLMGMYFSRLGGSFETPWPPVAIEVGPTPPVYHTHRTQTILNADIAFSRFSTRIASAFEDENWIPNETRTSCLGGAGWTGVGVSAVTQSGPYGVFSAVGAGRHYLEREVTLIAGKKYMYSLNFIRGGWNSAVPNMYLALTFVDPSNVERGATYVDGNVVEFINPASDHGVSWFAEVLNSDVGGVPNYAGSVAILLLEPTVSGTYKLRVNGVNYLTGTLGAFNGSGGEGWTVHGVTFHENWKVPSFVYSGNAGTYAGSSMNVLQPWGWMETGVSVALNGYQGRGSWSVSLLPNWDQKPKARMFEYDGTGSSWPRATITDNNGETVYAHFPFGGVPRPVSSPTIPLYPSLAGIRRKYYAEVKWLTGGGFPRLGIYPVGGSLGNMAVYWDNVAGILYTPTGNITGLAASSTINDVIGVGVDFASSTSSITVTLWKNGTEFATTTIPCSATGTYHPEEPWTFSVYPNERSGLQRANHVQVTLHEDGFAFKPSGYVAYDPLYIPGSRINDPTTENFKTLKEGLAIDLTDDGTVITVAFDPTEVPDDTFPLTKLANMSTGKLLGRTSASSGDIEEISAGSGILLASGAISFDPSVLATCHYQNVVLSDSPAMYYPGNQPTGSGINRVVTNLTATLNGSAIAASDAPTALGGLGYELVTSNDTISWNCAARASVGYNTDTTFECWFRSTNTLASTVNEYNSAFLIGQDSGGGGSYCGLGMQGACRPILGGGGACLTPVTGAWNDGHWHHVVATRVIATGAAEIFIDGVSVATGTIPAGTSNNNQTFGYWAGKNAIGWTGWISNVAIYNSILPIARIKAHYGAGTDGNFPLIQATTVANATGGANIDVECRAQLNALLAALRTSKIIGT